MLNKKCALFALVLLPSLLSAQRGSKDRGTKEPDWNKAAPASAPQLSSKDVESLNSIKMFIGKRKELKLTDEQVAQLKELDSKQNETNQVLMTTVDSLRKAAHPLSTSPDDVEKIRVQLAREALMNAIVNVRERNAESVKLVLPQFDEAQKKTAEELLQKQAKESDQMLSEKFGRGGRGRSDDGKVPFVTGRGRGGNN
ncbi:MAG: Spy/CpxP family protein refolding chaperone [Gemmatimonadaceae bacterium]